MLFAIVQIELYGSESHLILADTAAKGRYSDQVTSVRKLYHAMGLSRFSLACDNGPLGKKKRNVIPISRKWENKFRYIFQISRTSEGSNIEW